MTFFKFLIVAIMLILLIPTPASAAPSITLEDFHFGKFRYKQPFDKKLADSIYGKCQTDTMDAELTRENYKWLLKKDPGPCKPCVFHRYKTAIFVTIDNILMGAASTCEKGSSPRLISSWSDEAIIKSFGKPLHLQTAGSSNSTEKTFYFYGNPNEKKPVFYIFTAADKNKPPHTFQAAWAGDPMLAFHCLGALMHSDE